MNEQITLLEKRRKEYDSSMKKSRNSAGKDASTDRDRDEKEASFNVQKKKVEGLLDDFTQSHVWFVSFLIFDDVQKF